MDSNKQCMIELAFQIFATRLMIENKQPIKALDFIENMAQFAGCDRVTLRSVLNTIFTQSYHHMYSMPEKYYLLKQSNVPVRSICKRCKISNNTYYAMASDPEYTNMQIHPKYTPEQAEVMRTILTILTTYADCIDKEIQI